ncbi:5447_t:CDS:2 [Scutellospora calospora]|uniref:5447_t:CDS:1 n=1 Tax=Scutellospora calospora TaxID=85575 RepID=A0ACA9L1C9_9GLOM|nr:5447_t:CDS:2 [Scutellospora calospora]
MKAQNNHVQLNRAPFTSAFAFFATKKSAFLVGCPAITEGSISKKSTSGYRARYVCSECFHLQGGHFYENPGKGYKFVSCAELEKHKDDTSKALIDIRNWIILVGESHDQKLKKSLLSLLTPTLKILNNDSKNSLKIQPELPSSFLIKAALKLKFNSSKLTSARLSPENATSMGEKIENEEKMMLKIKAAQSERERLLKIISQYTGNVVINQNAHSIQSRDNLVQFLSAKLIFAFKNPDLAIHDIFEYAPGINEKDIEKILTCYETGKSCLEAILRQDVYQTEPRPKYGRGARNVDRYTYAKIDAMKKEKNKISNITIQQKTSTHDLLFEMLKKSSEASSSTQVSSSTQILNVEYYQKRKRRKTTDEEKTILSRLFEFSDTVLLSVINEIMTELEKISSDWTYDRIKQY